MGIAFAFVMSALSRRDLRSTLPNKESNEFKDNEFSLSHKQILTSVVEQLENTHTKKSTRQCPECNRNFLFIQIENIEIDMCKFCKSMWFDYGELKSLTEFSSDIPSERLRNRSSKHTCPICTDTMSEYVFKAPDNVLVDKCRNNHGVYLESNELVRIFKLIDN